MEIQFLAWDRHNNVVGLNQLIGSKPSSLLLIGFPTNDKKKKKPAQSFPLRTTLSFLSRFFHFNTKFHGWKFKSHKSYRVYSLLWYYIQTLIDSHYTKVSSTWFSMITILKIYFLLAYSITEYIVAVWLGSLYLTSIWKH